MKSSVFTESNVPYEIYTVQGLEVINQLNRGDYCPRAELRREVSSNYEIERKLLNGKEPVWGFIKGYKQYKQQINNSNLAEFIGSYMYETSRELSTISELDGLMLIKYISPDVFWGITENKNRHVVVTAGIPRDSVLEVLMIKVEGHTVKLVNIQGQTVSQAVVYELVDTSDIGVEDVDLNLEPVKVMEDPVVKILNEAGIDYMVAGGIALRNQFRVSNDMPTVLIIGTAEDALDVLGLKDIGKYNTFVSKVVNIGHEISEVVFEVGLDDEKYGVITDNVNYVVGNFGYQESVEDFLCRNPKAIDSLVMNLTKHDKKLEEMMDRIMGV